MARNLTDSFDGFLLGKRHLLMDRDGKFCPVFRAMLTDADVEPLRLPPRSPNLNSHLERFMRSIKDEALHRMIYFGENALRRATTSYLEHYHAERNHQGKDNVLLFPSIRPSSSNLDRSVRCRERLGGLLKYYHREAA